MTTTKTATIVVELPADQARILADVIDMWAEERRTHSGKPTSSMSDRYPYAWKAEFRELIHSLAAQLREGAKDGA